MRVIAKAGGKFREMFLGESLTARVVRSSSLAMGGFAFSQGLRLLSNLLLTRILFPEAFGLMALVMVLLSGLSMFSDVGTSQAIQQSKRGDEAIFLNTAFSIQIARGVLLFLLGCAFAYPVSRFYGEAVLFPMIMVASVQFLFSGFMPTRVETANRHLLVGRLTMIDMASQVISLLIMLALALWLRSVWALVLGGLIGTANKVMLSHFFLPGEKNRIAWDPTAFQELFHFGKWIFLSTAFGFIISQGDRLILGKFLALDDFGVYVIGFFLGSFPLMVGAAFNGQLLIPVYRDRPPRQSRENFLKLRKLRTTVSAIIFVLLAILAFIGPWLVDVMYDDRYLSAGVIVVLLSCFSFPVVVGMTYDAAALAAGKSSYFFFLSCMSATLTVIGLYFGVQWGGLVGALVGKMLGTVATYPIIVWLAWRLGVWDALHDLAFALIGLAIATAALWWHWPSIVGLYLGSPV